MERIEYSQVKTLAQTPFERYVSEEEIFFWKDTFAYYSGHGIAKIEGPVPNDFQEYIQTKYLDGKMGIIKEANTNNAQNTVYKIMSKEGLLAILLEIQDYFDRKYKKKEMGMVRYHELYAQLIVEILNEGNFNFTTEDWIQSTGYKTNPNTQEEDELIKAIKGFDKMVNPYMDSSIQLMDVKDYIPNLLISVKKEKWKKEEETALEITNKTNGDTVSYFRSSNNLCYQMRCSLGNNNFMAVFHTIKNQENNLKEEIEIQYWGLQENTYYHYNLEESSKEMREVILIHLQKALEISKTITIENMENKDIEQDYKRNKKRTKLS